MLTTTLNAIKAKNPCHSGWKKLLQGLSKEEADDEPLTFKAILEINGLKDALWALCVFDYKDYCLFNADMAESVLSIFEKRHPNDDRPRKAIAAIRDYHAGRITQEELSTAVLAAYTSFVDADVDVDAAAGYAAGYAASAAYAAYAAADADAYATATATATAYVAAARKAKWAEIEALFIKHFITNATNATED